MTIRQQLVGSIAVAYLATAILVIAASIFAVRSIIDKKVRDDFHYRDSVILTMVQSAFDELEKTGMRDQYQKAAQNEIIAKIRSTYYDGTSEIYPFIIDTAGVVLMHPKLDSGSTELQKQIFIKKMISLKNGDLKYLYEGGTKWMVFASFPEWGWIISYALPQKLMYKEVSSFAGVIVLIMVILTLIVCGAQFMLIGRTLAPLTSLTQGLTDIARGEGDLTRRIPIRRNDEIGKCAEAFNSFVEKLQSMVKEIAGNSNMVSLAAEELSAVSSEMSHNSKTMAAQSTTVATAAEQATANVNTISASAEEMSSSVSSVATSIEEMSASLGEVAKNCQKESDIASSANARAQMTKDAMERLRQSAREIGKVVEVINDIADQTNLLALNATIEAASAGDAGKGFAVVAGEVKDLARQTAQATGEIERQVEAMQTNTNSAVSAIAEITQIIENINTISQTIVSAVEEQSATVNEIAKNVGGANIAAGEIARNVGESARGLTEISGNISGVNSAATETSSAVQQVNQSIDELAKFGAALQQIVNRFKV